MKHIRNIQLMTFFAMMCSLSVFSQNSVSVIQNRYDFVGDSVYIDLTIQLNNTEISTRAFVLLTPVIQTENKSQELPTVLINGKNRHKTYLRMESIGRGPENVKIVIHADARDAQIPHHYSITVPYEDWMKDAVFAISEEQCDCNGPLVQISFNLMNGKVHKVQDEKPQAKPNFLVSYISPPSEQIKHRSESGKAFLDFAIGKSNLNTGMNHNASELAKIGRMINNAKSDPAMIITGVTIDGWASPDGTYTSNMTLSADRAAALKDYLQTVYELDKNLFNVIGHGEDWTSFEVIIANSDYAWKDEALHIIRSKNDYDSRERELKALQDGVVWYYLFDDIFPKLRRTDYELHYTVAQFTIEEGKKKLETNPSLLSLNEMYLIAQTYPAGSEDFQRVFEIAVKTFPDDMTANFNAAATALEKGDLEVAVNYMEKVRSSEPAWENNMGVIAAMQKRYAEASAYFDKAIAGNNSEAFKNLNEMKKSLK